MSAAIHTKRVNPDGTVSEVWLNSNREKESFNGEPAEICYYPKSDKVRFQAWCKNGKLHRENNQPALIKYSKNGNLLSKTWFLDGEKHREFGPAHIDYDFNQGVIEYYWYHNGVPYRDDELPNFVRVLDGVEVIQEWHGEGETMLVRENGEPNRIFYYPDGSPIIEQWVEPNDAEKLSKLAFK